MLEQYPEISPFVLCSSWKNNSARVPNWLTVANIQRTQDLVCLFRFNQQKDTEQPGLKLKHRLKYRFPTPQICAIHYFIIYKLSRMLVVVKPEGFLP